MLRTFLALVCTLTATTLSPGTTIVDAGVGPYGYDGFSGIYGAAIAQGFTLSVPVWNANVQALCKAGNTDGAPDISRFHLVKGATPNGALIDEKLVNLGSSNQSIYRTLFQPSYLSAGHYFLVMSSGSDLYNKIAWQNGPSAYNVTKNLGPAMSTVADQYNWQYPLASPWRNVVGDKTYRTRVTGDLDPALADPVPADGGLSVQASAGTVSGGGVVDLSPLGAVHHLEARSDLGQPAATATNTHQRFFRFARDDQAALPSTLYVGGLLDGTLEAGPDAVASVLASVLIRDTSGNELAKATWPLSVGDGFPLSGLVPVHEYVYCQASLMPGTTYEISSSLEVYAKSGPGGGALSSFADSFTVRISGTEIPEPSTVLLVIPGALLLGIRRVRDLGCRRESIHQRCSSNRERVS